MYKNPKHFDLKIRIYNEHPDFGKGVVQLMNKTKEFGSLSGAYKDMKMSNSKAWKILNRAEKDLDMDLIYRVTGGKNGGSSRLSDEGKMLLDKYQLFVNDVEDYAKQRFKEIFEDE